MIFLGPAPDIGLLLVSGVVVIVLGSISAAPAAIPLIIITEKTGTGHWWIFTSGGLVAGMLLLLLFEVPMTLTTPDAYPMIFLLIATSFAGATYWFLAWHIDPPEKPEEQA